MGKIAIVVHGGAGTWQSERLEDGLKGVEEAAKIGLETLKKGESALDSVEDAVASMEDNAVFNAGLGSSLAIDKRVEMEASIMDGKTLDAGAVGLLRDIKNPIKLARITMERTDHVFLVSDGAEKLANLFGLERQNPRTELRLKYWRLLKQRLDQGELTYLPKLRDLLHMVNSGFGTVGAIALDKTGNVAAATSTGGFSMKLPGRIGDSPLIGCGTYADNAVGACSVTGVGEVAIRLVLAKTTCVHMSEGLSAQEAAEKSIRLVNLKIPGSFNYMGLIVIDKHGRIGAAHNSPNLCWTYGVSGTKKLKGMAKAKIVKSR